jgi:hypothetical protein
MLKTSSLLYADAPIAEKKKKSFPMSLTGLISVRGVTRRSTSLNAHWIQKHNIFQPDILFL